jgi:glycosyltransferase involved in cell wall biosynthesis
MSEASSQPAPDVTLVVPVLSLEADVEGVVQALGRALDQAGRTWEALIVYDGVKGEPWEAGLRLQEQSEQQVRTIALHKPFGESVCLTSAFEHARGELILTSPQYVQVDPAELGTLLTKIEAGADLVSGWRFPRVDAGLNQLQSAAFNGVLRTLVGTTFHDLNCTLRLMRRDVLEQLTIYGNMYRYLPAIAHNQGFRVEEVKVRHLTERGSSGLFGPGVYVRRCLDILALVFLTKFTHKPLRFFGALGGTAMLAGTGVVAWEVVQRLLAEGGAGLYQRPLFLLGVLLFVLGVQLIGFGLVGEIIIFTQARNVREYRIERIHE